MDRKVFNKKYRAVRQMVNKLRELGSDENEIIRDIIQSVTFTAGRPDEKSYTESQLKDLFDLAKER